MEHNAFKLIVNEEKKPIHPKQYLNSKTFI